MIHPIKFYKELIKFDSSSDIGKDGIFDYVVGLLKSFKADFIEANRGRYIWATFGLKNMSDGLLLSGHLDVVPHKSSDAFELTIRDEIYYGRGTCDMKGFCAIALNIAERISGKNLKSPIHFCFTLDEEKDMNGIREAEPLFIKFHPKWCIVGEPTMMNIVGSNLGTLEGMVSVKGKAVHSSEPEKGINAINVLLSIMNFINALPGMVNIGKISGGTARNVLAENAFCEYIIRFTKDGDKLIRMIDDFISQQTKGEIIHTYTLCPPFEDYNGFSRQKMLSLLDKGYDEVGHVKYTTEAGFIQKYGIDSVICGPGSIGYAHKNDEQCSYEQLQCCWNVLNKITDEILNKE